MPATDAFLPLPQVWLILIGGPAGNHIPEANIACSLPLLQVQLPIA